jgi:LacI family transcriptional regulator, fructose operon transcriptional repressor
MLCDRRTLKTLGESANKTEATIGQQLDPSQSVFQTFRTHHMAITRSTIYDIADQAGSSAATVSAVLNGTWEKRRISADTAQRIQQVALKLTYNVNRQASGLRKNQSGLIGMMIPNHDNHFFSSTSQTFERMARERHLCPIVVSTLRDPALEVETAKTLISYQIEHLLVTGATSPDAVSKVCKQHGVRHLNIDLPGSKAPSVISDHYWGAEALTNELLKLSKPQKVHARNQLYFIGGIATDYATQRRVSGFEDAIKNATGSVSADQIDTCGYDGARAEMSIERLYSKLGGLPKGLFINSTMPLEGVVQFLKTLDVKQLNACAFGCFDWDPLATFLGFPLLMVRQNIEGLISKAFELIDNGDLNNSQIFEVRPSLVSSETRRYRQ